MSDYQSMHAAPKDGSTFTVMREGHEFEGILWSIERGLFRSRANKQQQ